VQVNFQFVLLEVLFARKKKKKKKKGKAKEEKKEKESYSNLEKGTAIKRQL
jgi:hypothetical protein